MREMIVDSSLGYIRGCLSKGVELESWKLVQTNGLVWIENQKIEVRIRNKTVNDFQAKANVREEYNSSEEPKSKEGHATLSVSKIQVKHTRFGGVNNYRRAGLLGCDRAGTW